MLDNLAFDKRYLENYRDSLDNPDAFWLRQSNLVDWIRSPEFAVDVSDSPYYRWFPGASLNTCHNALDRHVEAGHGDRLALIYDSPLSGTKIELTYGELLDKVATFAGVLTGLGVVKGDRVVVYMPLIPEAVVAMLACARIGAVHSVVFGGFAPQELASRIDDCRPKVILSASCGIEPNRVIEYKPLLDSALHLAEHSPGRCVIKQRPESEAVLDSSRDLDWDEALSTASAVRCEEIAATDPLYILYTSGTTGKPKGIVRDNGGHAVAMAWSLSNVFDIGPGQVWWAASDVGWVVGHSYIVYAPLICGATTVLYEGKPVGTPDAGAFWRVVSDYKVEGLFTAPTAIRAIRREDPTGAHVSKYDLSSLRTLFLAGERLDPDTYTWAVETLGLPVIDNWWQTETGWPIASNLRGLSPLPIKAGSPGPAVPGFDVKILGIDGRELGPNVEGSICIGLPLPPGSLTTLWGDDARYERSYLSRQAGFYLTGDGGYIDEDGYLFVMGRTDDVINVAGHRLSTGSMEGVLASHPDVAECAVIGAADALKGQVPQGFVVLKADSRIDPSDLSADLIALVRRSIGAIACFKEVTVVNALPKTRSGKILRRTIRELVDGIEPQVPATLEDPAVLDEFSNAMRMAAAEEI